MVYQLLLGNKIFLIKENANLEGRLQKARDIFNYSGLSVDKSANSLKIKNNSVLQKREKDNQSEK